MRSSKLVVGFYCRGEALFPRYSRGNGTFDQPSAVTWRFFTDIAMKKDTDIKQNTMERLMVLAAVLYERTFLSVWALKKAVQKLCDM